MRRSMAASLGTALVLAGLSGWWMVAHAAEREGSPRSRINRDTMRVVPAGVRIKVEVLNASGERGMARRAMHYLRDRGFDVVSVGNARATQDSSVIIDRSGHADWARMAAKAIRSSRVETRDDSTRYLDLTIVLGASFRAPPLVFYP